MTRRRLEDDSETANSRRRESKSERVPAENADARERKGRDREEVVAGTKGEGQLARKVSEE